MKTVAWALLFFFSIVSSLLAADVSKDSSVPYHNPIPLADLEGEPSAVVNGVNVMTGDFIECQCDMMIPGVKPLALERSCYSSDVRWGNLSRAWNFNFGSTLIIYQYSSGKKDNYEGVLLEGSGSTLFHGTIDRKKSRSSMELTLSREMLKKGVSNTSSGVIGGRTNIKNTKILWSKKYDYYVRTGSGVCQYFEETTEEDYNHRQMQITYEIDPAGDKIFYEYRKKDHLTWVKRKSPSGHYEASYQFDYDKKGIDVKTLDGHRIRYHLDEGLLVRVENDEAPWVKYQYETVRHLDKISRREYPDNRFLDIHYYQPGYNQVGVDSRTYDEEDECVDRVMRLAAPVGSDAKPITTHRFFYLKGWTAVYDAYNRQTHFIYNQDHRLTSIKKFDSQNQLYGCEKLYWGANGTKDSTNLLARAFANHMDWNQFARVYQYDESGNIVSDRLYGNLSGVNPEGPAIGENGAVVDNRCEYDEKKYLYSQDGLNLVTQEIHGKKVTSFFYEEGTDRLSARFKSHEGISYQREFFEYNQDGALIKEILDDGTHLDKNQLENVTERHIKIYRPLDTYPYGLPEIVEERYLDLSTHEEKLLHKTINEYFPSGRLKKQEHYDRMGQLAYALFWEYDAHGNVTKETDAIGRTIMREYDLNDNLKYQKGPDPHFYTIFDYDWMNRLIREEEIHADGVHLVTSHRYDYLGNCIATVDAYGQETLREYDPFGRVVQAIYPAVLNEEGQLYCPRTLTGYNEMSQVTSVTDARGHRTTIGYTIRGQPVTVTDPDQTSEDTLYYLNGLPKLKRAKNGTVTTFLYDYGDRVIKQEVRSSAGLLLNEIKACYDTFHLRWEQDAAGHVTTYDYNSDGTLRSKKKGDHLLTFEYDHLGRIHKTISTYGPNPGDIVANVQKYDILNRVVEERVEDSQGTIQSKVQYEYDLAGNRTKVIHYFQKGPSETITIYNSRKEPCKVIDAEGHVTTTLCRYDYYNEQGQCVPYKEITDPLGNLTVMIADALGREVCVLRKNSLGQIVQKREMTYDAVGNPVRQLETVMNPLETERQILTCWKYDALNRITDCYEAVGTPEQKHTAFVYDELGQKAQIIKPDGTILLHTYDPLGRLESFCAADGTFHYTYQYDLNGHLIKALDLKNHCETTKEYDDNDKLVKETLGNGLSLHYERDAIGRPTKMTFPNGTHACYEYHANQLNKINREGKEPYTHMYKLYDLSGHIVEAQLIGNAGFLSYQYDILGRLRETKAPHWEEKLTQFDAAGNLLMKETQSFENQTPSNFTYDDLYQLNTETGRICHDYAYDSLYNCVSKDGKGRSFNSLNQLVSDATLSYAYDMNGNLRQKGLTASYEYDALDRLVCYSEGNRISRYSYDESNRRLSKRIFVNGHEVETIRYLYEGQNEIGSCDVEGNILELRILGIGRGAEIGAAVAIELGGKIYAPIHDHQGNVVVLIDCEGNAFESYRYSAFGEEQNENAVNPWRFSSKRVDEESGLVYFGRRYYDPGTARWLTPDPIGLVAGPNLYAYVLNSPLLHVDLFGLFNSPGEVGLHHSYRNKDGTYNNTRNRYIEKGFHYVGEGIRLPGRVLETVGHHAIPIPIVKDGVEFAGWCLGFKDPKKYIPDWKRPHSQIIDYKGINGQMGPHATFMHYSGMGVSYDEARKRTEDLSERMGGIDVTTVYKGDRGMALNFLEYGLQLLKIPIKSTQIGREAAALASSRVGPNGTIFVTAHSQGGLVLHQADADIKRKMIVITMGSAKIARREDYLDATNYIAQYDIIPYVDAIGLFKGYLNGNIYYLKSQGNFLKDHLWDAQTYQHIWNDVLLNMQK